MTCKNIIRTAAICLLFITVAGCKGFIEQPAFVSIFSTENTTAVLKTFELLSDNSVVLTFEGKVTDVMAHAIRENSNEEIACTSEELKPENNSENDEIHTVFKISPAAQFKPGEAFTLAGSAECGKNNILDFSLPFFGANSNPASLIFSEIRVGTTKSPAYIKFKVSKAGNLFGLYLRSAAEKGKDYVFPAAEVQKDEIVVLHRYIPANVDSVTDEINNDGECTAPGNFTGERDFWHTIKKFTPSKSNIFLLKTGIDGTISDVLVIAALKENEWTKDGIKSVIKEAEKSGIWKPDCSIENAVRIDKGDTVYFFIPKDGAEKSCENWKSSKDIPPKPENKISAEKVQKKQKNFEAVSKKEKSYPKQKGNTTGKKTAKKKSGKTKGNGKKNA